MVELTQGDIVEERRGGANILATLAGEMARLSNTGYIRSERTPQDSMPRVGQVIIQNGSIVAAMHEQDAFLEGLEALLEIEEDCMALDCRIQIVDGVDTGRILELYPGARLEVNAPEKSESSQWWSEVSTRSSGWTRASRLPAMEASVEAPEFIQRKAAAMVHKLADLDNVLSPGAVHLSDDDSLFELASILAKHGRPLLVLSRRRREDIAVEFSIVADSCLWLSQAEGEGVQFVDLDAIMGTVRGFFEGNLRAVILIEGVEYLSNICGTDSTIDMLRSIADRVRMEDHCLLISADLSAFEQKSAAQLKRIAPYLQTDTISSWIVDPESILDHPLMAAPSEEELLRLSQHIEDTLPEEFVPEPVEEVLIEEVPVVIEEEEIIIIEDIEPEPVVEIPEPEPEPEVPKGPRMPQRVKRNRKRSIQVASAEEISRSSLSAVAEVEIATDMPSEELLPMTAVGEGRSAEFREIPEIIPNDLSDVVRQDATNRTPVLPKTELGPKPLDAVSGRKNVEAMSPVAARGIEVRRNIKDRSQASSVPQRPLDIDAELRSWRFEEVGESD